MFETCVGLWTDRHFPATTLAEQARALEASGHVSAVLIPDQLASFVPAQLWTPEHTPFAGLIGDPDSAMDAFMVAPYIHAAAPSLDIHLSTDSVRRGPAELIQSMLTLAHLTEGRATFQIGAGEAKQTRPFGHPTNQGLSRMQDLLQLFHALMDADGPIDFVGRRWKFERAYLGEARQHRPMLWALGGGPQLLDYATSWADGLAIAVPNALSSPERARDAIADVRRMLEDKDRDPEAFRIGLWASVLIHPDAAALEAAFENPLLKFISAAVGRVESALWERDGMALPFPPGWAYYKDLLPYATEDALIERVLSAVTADHVRAGWILGSPQEIAAQLKPYLELGIDWVAPFDYLPVIGDPADAAQATDWMIELCSELRRVSGDSDVSGAGRDG